MASTKIINVLKDDKFEEILDLFKETSAKEVIFVLPKTSKSFKKEEQFVILDNEASKSGKKISLLCSNPDTNKMAKKYKFDVLLTQDSDNRSPVTAVNQFDDDSPHSKDEVDEEIDDENEKRNNDEEEEYQESEKVFAPAIYREDSDESDEYQTITVSRINRGLEDIVKKDGKPLKISSQREKLLNLDVKRKSEYNPEYDIKNVWREQSERASKENIWSGINSRTKKSFKNFPKKSLIGLGVASVVLLGTVVYMSTGNAKITITPHKKPLDIRLKISSSDKFSSVNFELNRIPGQLFNIEKTATQTFTATGEKEVAQKARGKIIVFNEYGTSPQPLIATTRFQTSDGLIFRTLKGITVPGTKVENGKIIPGSIGVEVIADKPGQSYNVPAGKFSIPAFNERGDAGRYEKIYGKSDEAMKGGATGKAKVVTESDFNTAKQTLSDQVTKDIQNSLKIQTSGLEVINSSAIKLKDPESTAKVDEAADSFVLTINGSIKTIGFKKNDLETLIKQFVDRTQNLTVVPEKLNLSFDNIVLDETNNIQTFTVNIKGNGYTKISVEKIKTDLLNKNEKDIKEYFNNVTKDTVESARVLLTPFWVKKIPQDKERINIEINY